MKIGTAKYFISSIPEGASIFIDERNTGLSTPDTIKWIEDGIHNFRLKLYPFEDYSFNEYIVTDSSFLFDYNFYSNPANNGEIKFISNPSGCTVYLNDTLMNFTTPYILKNIPTGNYKIEFTYSEHRRGEKTIRVLPKKQSFVEMNLIDTSVWVNYNNQNSDLIDNIINDIFVDENNIIWIATSEHGLIKRVDGENNYITAENSNLPSNRLVTVKGDNQNNIWIGTDNGLVKMNGPEIVNYNMEHSSISNTHILDFDFDKDGNLWIGTENGLTKLNGNMSEQFNVSNSNIPENYITSVLVDENNRIWVGTKMFNIHYSDNQNVWYSYLVDEKYPGDYVSDLIIDLNNNLLIGLVSKFSFPFNGINPGGIYILDNENLIELDFNLPQNNINRFYFDDNNLLWIGTSSGVLSVLSQSNYKLYSANNSGLDNSDITAISKDKKGNMWFGTNGGGLVKYKIWKE